MAEIDFGVITIKNGKLLPENEQKGNYQGEMGQLWLPQIGLFFRRTYIGKINPNNSKESDGEFLRFNDLINSLYYLSNITQDYDNDYQKPHYVKYWSYNKINFKTKFVGHVVKKLEPFDQDDYFDDVKRCPEVEVTPIYETSFKLNNDFYHVLHGYDISLKNNCWYRSTKTIINKFLKKHLQK